MDYGGFRRLLFPNCSQVGAVNPWQLGHERKGSEISQLNSLKFVLTPLHATRTLVLSSRTSRQEARGRSGRRTAGTESGRESTRPTPGRPVSEAVRLVPASALLPLQRRGAFASESVIEAAPSPCHVRPRRQSRALPRPKVAEVARRRRSAQATKEFLKRLASKEDLEEIAWRLRSTMIKPNQSLGFVSAAQLEEVVSDAANVAPTASRKPQLNE
jgi:hypothetical protein